MNILSVITSIFGEYPNSKHIHNADLKRFTLSEHISEINSWLDEKLNSCALEDEVVIIDGKIGPSKVLFDVIEDGSILISRDRLTLNSQNAFSTIKANCCVYSGKWMYEVQLRSKGVMQIGWCSNYCKFTQDTGVGDTRFSYGLDGSKQRIWHIYTKKYGPYWRSGDIFGVCVDMDNGHIEYYRNGISLGIAFKDIERGPGLALYPAVSLAYNDSLSANFGGSPLKYPVEGYSPLQEKPNSLLLQADLLLQYLVNLSGAISRQTSEQSQNRSSTKINAISYETVYMVLSSILIEKIAPILLNSYVVEDKVFAYIKSMCVLRSNTKVDSPIQPGSLQSTLGTFLTLLWTYLEPDEMKLFLKKILNFLANTYKETPSDLEYEKQRKIIVILSCICNHPQTRKYLIEFKFFKKNCLPLFLYTKPPDETTLEQLLPDNDIWTEGIGGNKNVYIEGCSKLQSYTSVLYTLQKNLIHILLNNNDATENSPSSRKIFMVKLRKFVLENNMEHRGYSSTTQPAIGLSFLCTILDVAKQLWETEVSTAEDLPYISSSYFYDSTFNYSNIDRIGGVLSYLKKHYRSQLLDVLGEGQPFSTQNHQDHSSDFYNAMQSFSILTAGTNGGIFGHVSSSNESVVSPGTFIDNRKSICELIDCSILFYYSVAHKYVVMIADLRDNITHLSGILQETKSSCDEVIRNLEELRKCTDTGFSIAHEEILSELNERFGQRQNIFAKRSMELARKQAWYRSVALGQHRRTLLSWLLSVIFKTLDTFSNEGLLFSFLPEVYLNILPILIDTILDFSFHDTGVQHDLTDDMPLINSAAEFLAKHLADGRVILASCKDALIQALGSLTCHEAGVKALENTSKSSQMAFVKALLRPYENRAWGQSNWLLLRFWLGDGFAYRESRHPSIWQVGKKSHSLGLLRSRAKNGPHTGLLHLIAPAYPSAHFQNSVSQILNEDEPFCTIFLNSVLSQLNWAFSEFIHILQEIQNLSQKDEHLVIETKQLKICAMCFDLTVSLMRALEMIISITPNIFDDGRPNSDIILGRICQLVIQVMSRVSVPPSCFQHVIDLCLPDLGNITHFAIISASVGILLALMKNELNDDCEENITKIPKISRYLLTDTSFQIANLEYSLGEVKSPLTIVKKDIPRGNFDPKIPSPYKSLCGKEIVPEIPIIKFNMKDYYPTHVSQDELEKVRRLIDALSLRQTLLSEITILSEESLCTICYAKQNSAIFHPCNHQSCENCILQHLMNNKLCFYCKLLIKSVTLSADGTVIYWSSSEQPGEPTE